MTKLTEVKMPVSDTVAKSYQANNTFIKESVLLWTSKKIIE